MPKKKIAVLGGGASGLMAAITAAQSGAKVSIIEHKDRVGKKILMTGNGKCNLTNLHMDDSYYYSHDLEKAMRIMEEFTPQDTIAFFRELGLMTKEKRDGGIYPVAEQASVVLDILRATCDRLGIETVLNCHIEQIKPGTKITLNGYQEIEVESETSNSKKSKGKQNKNYIRKSYTNVFDALILACGGCAASVSGSDGSGYDLVKKLGCKVYSPFPALVQLHGKGDFFKGIAGVRVESSLQLYVDRQVVAKEYGELQLTDYGISGIPVFQFSRIVASELSFGHACEVEIDFYPYDKKPLNWEAFPDLSVETFLEGYLNKKLVMMLLKRANIAPEQRVHTVPKRSRDRIFTEMHHFIVPVEKTNGFDSAQVCAGGVSLQDIEDTLSLKKQSNVYVAGELLDVDGKCGGYNLQWAWSTGYIAGKNAAIS